MTDDDFFNENQEEKSPSSTLDFSFILASSVHDMKNSLGMLLNSLEEVIEESPAENDQQKKRFSILQYEANRINTELIQLLSLYRFQNETMAINIDENFLLETIEDQIARNDMLFKTQDVELVVDCDPDLAWFYDNELLGNVVHNVLVNGTRYANKKMLISARHHDDGLMIEISDDGRGFPESMIDAAATNGDAPKEENSTQLGLFFAAKIAQLHYQKDRYGYIELSNGGVLGGGVFTIFIP